MKHYAMMMLLTGAGLMTACGSAGFIGNNAGQPDNHSDNAAQTEQASVETTFPEKTELPDLLDFTAKTLDGKVFTAADFAAADVTVINIWSTTCGPCIHEIPNIASYAASLPDNVQVMTWCLDAEVSPDADKITGFLADCGFDGVTLTSGDGDMQSLYSSLRYTPTTVFVDSTGKMVSEPIIGAVDIKTIYTEHINAALETLGKDKITV